MKKLILTIILFCSTQALADIPKTVILNNDLSMPVLGLGTWTLDDKTAEEIVYFAIKEGYRLIDTARYYRNEKGIGKAVSKAIKDGLVTRDELFITSKILPGKDAEREIDASLSDFRTSLS